MRISNAPMEMIKLHHTHLPLSVRGWRRRPCRSGRPDLSEDHSVGAAPRTDPTDQPRAGEAAAGDRSGPYPEPVDERSLWEGRTLRQWLPGAVQDVVRAAAPRRIVLFGSVARGDEGPDSDLDLLVVFDRIDPVG